MIASLINTMNSIEASENDLTSFKSYLEERIADPDDKTGLREAVSGVQYSYNLNLPIYTENTDGNIILSDVNKLMRESMLKNWSSMTGMNYSSLIGGQNSSMSSSFSTLFQEMLPGKEGEPFSDIFYSQYELIYGDWPKEYDEIASSPSYTSVDEDMPAAGTPLFSASRSRIRLRKLTVVVFPLVPVTARLLRDDSGSHQNISARTVIASLISETRSMFGKSPILFSET